MTSATLVCPSCESRWKMVPGDAGDRFETCPVCRRDEPKLRKPLRAQPRSKGNRAEREIIDLLHAHGWTGARRNFQSGGQGGGDIIGGPGDVHVEVKHRERCSIWDWIEQAHSDARPTDLPLVAFRRNRSAWMACVPLDELLALLKLRETA